MYIYSVYANQRLSECVRKSGKRYISAIVNTLGAYIVLAGVAKWCCCSGPLFSVHIQHVLL